MHAGISDNRACARGVSCMHVRGQCQPCMRAGSVMHACAWGVSCMHARGECHACMWKCQPCMHGWHSPRMHGWHCCMHAWHSPCMQGWHCRMHARGVPAVHACTGSDLASQSSGGAQQCGRGAMRHSPGLSSNGGLGFRGDACCVRRAVAVHGHVIAHYKGAVVPSLPPLVDHTVVQSVAACLHVLQEVAARGGGGQGKLEPLGQVRATRPLHHPAGANAPPVPPPSPPWPLPPCGPCPLIGPRPRSLLTAA